MTTSYTLNDVVVSRDFEIQEVAEECSLAFRGIFTSVQRDKTIIQRLSSLFKQSKGQCPSLDISDLRDEYESFRVWTDNIGVFAKDCASLDHRLRDASDVKQALVSFLVSLNDDLLTVLRLLRDDDQDDEREREAARSEEEDSEDEYESLDDIELSADEIQSRLDHISTTISRLFSLARAIRTSGVRSRITRAANHVEYDSDGVDQTAAFEETYLPHVLRYRHHVPECLLPRFCKAISMRRRLFMYQRKHQKRLAYNGSSVNKSILSLHPAENLQLEAITPSRSQLPVCPQLGLVAAVEPKTYAPSGITAPTKATTYHSGALKRTAPSTMVASTSKLALNTTEFPPPPVRIYADTHVECPYCCLLLEAQKTQPVAWRKHVTSDLQPFICIEPDCPNPNVVLESWDDWVEHHKWTHAIEWWCEGIDTDHSPERFVTAIEYSAHLLDRHMSNLAIDDIRKQVKTGGGPSQEPFKCCPFCEYDHSPISHAMTCEGLDPLTIAKANQKKLQQHLFDHLLSMFMLALPERNDIEDAADQDDSSQQLQSKATAPISRSSMSWLDTISTSSDIVATPVRPRLSEMSSSDEDIEVSQGVEAQSETNNGGSDHVHVKDIVVADPESTNNGFQPSQELLAQLAAHGDIQGVADALQVLKKAESKSLIAAILNGHEEVLEMLIAKGQPDPDPEPIDSNSVNSELDYEHSTPMLAAIGKASTRIVKLLVEQPGFNPRRTINFMRYYEILRARKEHLVPSVWLEQYRILKEAHEDYLLDSFERLRNSDEMSPERYNSEFYADWARDYVTLSQAYDNYEPDLLEPLPKVKDLLPEDILWINNKAAEMARSTPNEQMERIVGEMDVRVKDSLEAKNIDPIIYHFRIKATKEFLMQPRTSSGDVRNDKNSLVFDPTLRRQYLKCSACHLAKTKCLPIYRVWPNEKCQSCDSEGLICGPNRQKSKQAAATCQTEEKILEDEYLLAALDQEIVIRKKISHMISLSEHISLMSAGSASQISLGERAVWVKIITDAYSITEPKSDISEFITSGIRFESHLLALRLSRNAYVQEITRLMYQLMHFPSDDSAQDLFNYPEFSTDDIEELNEKVNKLAENLADNAPPIERQCIDEAMRAQARLFEIQAATALDNHFRMKAIRFFRSTKLTESNPSPSDNLTASSSKREDPLPQDPDLFISETTEDSAEYHQEYTLPQLTERKLAELDKGFMPVDDQNLDKRSPESVPQHDFSYEL